jgi:acyl carrier protein
METMTADARSAAAIAEIERRIITFVQRELLSSEATIGRDEDLLSGGLLDSIGVLRLAAFVEEEFHFAMPPGDFVVENFRSVAALASYVRGTAAGRPPEDAGE